MNLFSKKLVILYFRVNELLTVIEFRIHPNLEILLHLEAPCNNRFWLFPSFSIIILSNHILNVLDMYYYYYFKKRKKEKKQEERKNVFLFLKTAFFLLPQQGYIYLYRHFCLAEKNLEGMVPS